ncbi:MAG: LCP family protein [Coriobacteriales bacterium]|nr:LCP family protein [Coriobacteriales bacterium]
MDKSDPSHKKLKTALIIAGSVFLALIIGVATYAAVFMTNVSEAIKMPDDAGNALDKVLVQPEQSEDAFYALIIGSDSRDSSNLEAGLSDTMMLARIDPETSELTILSIPRDVEIQLEGYGSQKINASFTYGGPAGAVDAVSELCGVPIAYYIEIDFPGLISLVDTLDGIDVQVPEDIYLDGVYIPAGEQHLGGEQALIMSRCRSFPTGDLVRVENQRIVLQAIVMKVLATDIASMPGLIERLASNVGTTMELTTAIDLVMKFRGMNPDNMRMTTVPTFFNNHDGASYLGVVEPDFSDMMARINEGLPPVDPAAPPPEEGVE